MYVESGGLQVASRVNVLRGLRFGSLWKRCFSGHPATCFPCSPRMTEAGRIALQRGTAPAKLTLVWKRTIVDNKCISVKSDMGLLFCVRKSLPEPKCRVFDWSYNKYICGRDLFERTSLIRLCYFWSVNNYCEKRLKPSHNINNCSQYLS